MIGTVVSVKEEFTTKGDPYKKVEVLDGTGKQTTKNIFSQLEDKWPLLENGKTLEFKMEKKGQFWNVVDIFMPELPEPKPAGAPLPAQQREIEKATADPRQRSIEYEVAFKECGELYRAGFLSDQGNPGERALLAMYKNELWRRMGLAEEFKP